MSWKAVQEEAAKQNIWLLNLGKDSLNNYYVAAGPSSIIVSINKKLLLNNQKQIETPEEIPYQLLLDLQLPIVSHANLSQAGEQAYLQVLNLLQQ